MKILLLTKKFPFPVKDGESLAINNLSRALRNQGASLDLLAMNTPKHGYEGKSPVSDLDQFDKIQLIDIDTGIRIFDAFKHLFKSDSYNITRFVSENYTEALIQFLQQQTYDIIQLETLYLAPYISTIRKYSKARIVMRAHNVEHEIWDRIANNAPRSIRKWYISHLTKRLKTYELAQLKEYDILAPITERDNHRFREFGYTGQSIVTPIGIAPLEYEPDPGSFNRPISLSFIGSLDWMPNLEGLRWFLNHAWKPILRAHPKVSLHIAGRNTPEWLYKLANKNLKIQGEVPEATTFINQHSIMIVPLLSGSGMRAKILEGMALGKVILTTSIGLEGIEARHKKEVLVADTPKAFLEALNYCNQLSSDQLHKIGLAARQLIETRYSNGKIGENLLNKYSKKGVEVQRL